MSTNTHTSSTHTPKISIRTKLVVSAAITIGLAVLVALTVFLQYKSVGQAARTARFTREVIKEVSELNSLGYAYLLLKDERPKIQWQLRHGAMGKLLSEHVVKTPQEKALIAKLRSNLGQMKGLFDVLVKGTEEDRTGAKNAALSYDELIEGITAQLMARSEMMVNDASLLGRESTQRVDAVQRQSLFLVLASAFMLIVSAFVTAFLLVKSIGGSILILKQGTQRVAAGDFEYRLEMPVNDELGELGRAFDDMSEQLQRVTVSKNRLEQEVEERRRVEEELHKSEQRWATTLASIGDAVIATDIEGKIAFMNTVAEEMTGWKLAEAATKSVPEVFNIVNEQSRREVENPVTKVLREGMIVGLANHTILIRKDGTEVAIDDSGAPIRDGDGKVIGVVLVFRDITERKQAEEELETHRRHLEEMVHERTAALQRTEDLLNETQRITKVGGWEFDVITRRVIWTDEVYRIHEVSTAYDPSSPEQDIQFYAPEDQKRIADAFQRAVEHGESYDLELQLVTAQGNRIWVRTMGQVESEDGKVVRVFGNILDITELKKAQTALQGANAMLEQRVAERTEELRQSEERFRLALKNSPVSVAVQDRNLVYQWAYNQQTRRPDEIIGKTDADLFAPEDIAAIREVKLRVLESGAEEHVQYWLTSNGRRLFLDLHYEPLRGSAGEITGIGIAVVDLTEQKLAEEELHKGRIDMDRAQEVGQIGSWRLDIKHNVLTWSDENHRIFGVTKGTPLTYEAFLAIIHPDDRQYVHKQWNAGLAGEPYDIEHRIVVNGQVKWVREKAYLEFDDTGALLGGFGITQDITERKQLEEELRRSRDDLDLRVRERTAELEQAYQKLVEETEENQRLEAQLRQSQKMEAIGTLAGGIAHDFNNILAAIIGFGEMVEEDLPPDSPSIPRIQRVLSAASRGTELVRQILAFSRKTELTRKPLSLAPLVQETIQFLRASLPTTIEIKLSMKAARDSILASPAELHQILMNLVTNASFAMKEAGGILGINVTNVDFEPDSPVFDADIEPGEYVQLTVTDTGSGMAPDVMKRIFEPFFTTKEVGEGTGMGLPVVYGVVKSLHGTITVESEPGAGSTFRVFLPIARTDERSEGIEAQVTPKGSERILFVDDEEMLTEWGQAALERQGYSVTALTDSTEALNLFSSDPSRFDLVITDQTMPKLTGLHLARRLLKIRNNIPIILCTGHSDSTSPEKAKEAGIKEFLIKPLGKQQLAAVVRRVIDTKSED